MHLLTLIQTVLDVIIPHFNKLILFLQHLHPLQQPHLLQLPPLHHLQPTLQTTIVLPQLHIQLPLQTDLLPQRLTLPHIPLPPFRRHPCLIQQLPPPHNPRLLIFPHLHHLILSLRQLTRQLLYLLLQPIDL